MWTNLQPRPARTETKLSFKLGRVWQKLRNQYFKVWETKYRIGANKISKIHQNIVLKISKLVELEFVCSGKGVSGMYSNNHIKPNQIELWLSWGFDKNFKKIRKQNSKFLESKYRIGTQNLSNSSNKSQTRLSVWKQNIELEQRKSLKFFLKISKKSLN